MPDRNSTLPDKDRVADSVADVNASAGLDFELQRLNDAPAVATKEATDSAAVSIRNSLRSNGWSEDSSWLHGQSAGENTGDASLAMELQRLSDEGRLTPEDLAELAALDRDARRLETLERINMGIVNCIWEALL